MTETHGLNHLGLAVADLAATTSFFVNALGWKESGRDESYPRTAVTDGKVRLTLWQVDHSLEIQQFNRRKNVGLHHLAIEVNSREDMESIYRTVSEHSRVEIEFEPELLGDGPRMHMMCSEPGGIRIEFIWAGT